MILFLFSSIRNLQISIYKLVRFCSFHKYISSSALFTRSGMVLTSFVNCAQPTDIPISYGEAACLFAFSRFSYKFLIRCSASSRSISPAIQNSSPPYLARIPACPASVFSKPLLSLSMPCLLQHDHMYH